MAVAFQSHPIDPIKRTVSAYNMKWQERHCGSRAWTAPDCHVFLYEKSGVVGFESLVLDWERGLRELVDQEVLQLDRCYAIARNQVETNLVSSSHSIHNNRLVESGESVYERAVEQCLDLKSLNSNSLWLVLEDHFNVYRSVYVDQLSHWTRHFPSNRFMLWSSEAFEMDPDSHMLEMVSWLGLDVNLINPEALARKHHVRQYIAAIPKDVELKLQHFFAPHMKRLDDFLHRHHIKNPLS